MRRCRLTFGVLVVFLGGLANPAVHAAVDAYIFDLQFESDFGDDFFMAGQALAPPVCASEGGCECISNWQGVSSRSSRYLGNAYRISHNRKLSAFEIALSFNGVTDLCFSIHRKLASDAGADYELVWSGTATEAQGAGTAEYYSSGVFDAQTDPQSLEAGYIYALGVQWDAAESVTAGYELGLPSGFSDFDVIGYVLDNSVSGCPDSELVPGDKDRKSVV